MHRVILGVASEKWIDHENRNGLDNRRENLRVATNRQNLQNSRKRSGTVSRFKGVSFDKHYRKWQARIQACTIGPGGHVRRVFLGSFDDEEDAARAYDAAALASFGRFARMNFMEQKVACND